nr:unnamed protein product [Digitaria exilis]
MGRIKQQGPKPSIPSNNLARGWIPFAQQSHCSPPASFPQTPAMTIPADPTADQASNPAPDEAAGEAVEARAHPDHGGSNAEAADEDYEEEEEELDGPAAEAAENEKVEAVFRRLSEAPVGIRVHDVTIRGNTKTRDALIEAEAVDLIRSAATVQDLVRAASIANARLRRLEVFDSVLITLDSGPPELPGTTNVVIEVVEAANPIDGNVGCFSKPEVSELSELLK